MDKNQVFIEIKPKKHDIDEIIVWLKRECDINGDGFYHNRNIILESFENNRLIALKYGEKNIGLVTWSEMDILVDVDIFVIEPIYRNQGYGNILFKAMCEYFSNKGFKTIKLFCMPRLSERFWKTMGLEKYPECGYTEHELTYYGVLLDTASTTYISSADKIELWDEEPDNSESKEAKWIWYIELSNGKLTLPIIQPCNCNWKLRWSRNGTVVKEEKVKYFTDKFNELFRSSFLFVESLIE